MYARVCVCVCVHVQGWPARIYIVYIPYIIYDVFGMGTIKHTITMLGSGMLFGELCESPAMRDSVDCPACQGTHTAPN